MKLAPTSLGAEPKKVALLIGIIVVGGVVYYIQNQPDTPVSANVAPPPPVETQPLKPLPQKQVTTEQQAEVASRGEDGAAGEDSVMRRGPLGGTGNDTFIPSMKHKDDLDISKIDPRIHLDLLAKVRAVPLEGGSSSLFDFSKAPEPPAPKIEIKPQPVPVPPPAAKQVTTVSKAATPPTPPPTPVPFKYYGYAGKSDDGQLQGLFEDGDSITSNIYPKREGDVIKDRWKIVHIGLKSATVEDTMTHNQQTLRLLEEPQQ